MHEIGLMREALDIALEHAAQQGARRIDRMIMRVGDASGVDADSLSLAFNVITSGTIAEGARLDIERILVACYCKQCNREFIPPDLLFACPQCHQITTEVRSGRTLELGPIEMT